MKSIIIACLFALACASSIPAFNWSFSPKTEYVYKFDGLLLSGLPTENSDASQVRISSRARIQMIDERNVRVQMFDIEFSAINGPQSENLPRFESSEKRETTEKNIEIMELPFAATIKNNLVSEIEFSDEDAEWSMNGKRSILNMISFRLSAPIDEMLEHEEESRNMADQAYFNNERTIEGDCQCAYNIVRENGATIFTKTVNFERCISRPEYTYGLRFSTECKECEKNGQYLKPQTVYTYTFENDKLQKSEVHSIYTLNVNGQEVVKSETRSVLVYERENRLNSPMKKVSGPKGELMYSTRQEQMIEKFYKNGDKAEVNPFEKFSTEEKMDQLREILDEIKKTEQNTPETVHLFARVVRLFRMFTVEEHSKVHTAYENAEKKIQVIIENAMAVAGTKNTIQHLISDIENKVISPLRAAELLKSIQETHYPSSHIVDLLIELARSPLAEKYESLRQSAWLAVGSVIRGCATTTQDYPLIREQTRQLKEKYLKTLMQQFHEAENTYEKVLALKVLGNAGLDVSVNEIERIILDTRQHVSIRIEAVESLRLLKDLMPKKIQRVLLPVYMNRQYAPELRMAALWRMMNLLPNESVLAHIVSKMERESNQHVAAFTYQVIRQFARSTNPCNSRFAARCSKVLTFTRYQPQEQLLSTYAQLPLFSSELLSGVQFDFATIFEKNAYLPKEIYASLESVFGGNWNKYAAQVGFSQQNVESIIVKTVEKLTKMSKQSDATRTRRVQNGLKMLNEIVKKMNIRPRVQSTESKNAYAVLYFRYKDMDYAVLPIDMEIVDSLIEKYVKDGQVDTYSLRSLFSRDQEFELHRALFLYEATRMIPTTIGTPLIISGKIPTIFSVKGKIALELENLKARVTVDITPNVVSTHVTEMRFIGNLFETGVKSIQSARIHTPVRVETTVELNKNLEFSWKVIVPEEKKSTISLHTRPVAFVRVPTQRDEYVEAEEKTIVHPQYQMSAKEVERYYEVLGLKMAVRGNYLSQWNLPQLLMTSQEFEYTLENKNRPVEFSARLNIGRTEKASPSEIKFDKIFEKEFDMELPKSEKRREHFHEMVRKVHSGEGFKHSISLKLEAAQKFELTSELKTVCDNEVRMCKWEVDMRRSPIMDESKEWTLRTEFVAVRPEMPSTLRQLREQPHREIQVGFNAKWGSSQKNEIKINVQLEQSKEQKEYVRGLKSEYNGLQEYELLVKAARLNQFTFVSEYKLTEETKNTLNRYFELHKSYNLWTLSESHAENEDNRVLIRFTVEPMSRQYANITIRAPEQNMELRNMPIQRVVLPSIARRSLRQEALETTGAYCKVDRSEVSTFDKMIYQTPLNLCYSLVTKDCSEEPTFAVLAKKLSKRSDDLMIKVIRSEEEIVVKRSDDEFIVKVDDKKIERSEFRSYEIELVGDNLIVIRLPEGEVRFDGYTVKSTLSSIASSSRLCGLCGNNDGESDNEFSTAENYDTEDVEEFHRSFTLKDDECNAEEEYVSEKKSEKKNYKRVNNYEDEEERSYSFGVEKIESSVQRNIVKESSHRVCISMEPVHQCSENYEAVHRETKKISFTCMNRHSAETRRYLKDARSKPLYLSERSVSYVEPVKVPSSCTLISV